MPGLVYGITAVLSLAGVNVTALIVAQAAGGAGGVENPALFWANTGLLASIVALLGAIVRAMLRGDLVVIRTAERDAQMQTLLNEAHEREERLQEIANGAAQREDRLWTLTRP